MNVANQASALVFPTPWTQRYFEIALHLGAGDCRFGRHLIPYISGECVVPRMTSAPDHARFVSIFRLDAWRLKNVERVITALAKLREGGEAGTLDIIGGGSPKAVKAIERVIARHRASHYVRLLGEKNRTEIDCLLPEYCAMVLPSFPESFGLVYLEALTAGVPVMTARNAGFDGYFESAFPGVIVAHDNVTEIMEGLQTLSRDAGLLRKRIVQEEGSFGIFERDRIVRSYEKLISDVLE
jgi:glycosyltransferase involved in cell wall biosynthesis